MRSKSYIMIGQLSIICSNPVGILALLYLFQLTYCRSSKGHATAHQF